MSIFDGEYECPFCLFVEDEVTPVWQHLFPGSNDNEILWSSNTFILALDTAPLTEGHVLIFSRKHETSFSVLINDVESELRQAVSIAGGLLSAAYGEFTYFEHGAMSFTRNAGACVDHAHLHLVPGLYNLLPSISTDYPEVARYADYESALHAMTGNPYVLFGSQSFGTYATPAPRCTTQYLRKLISIQANVPDRWNWRDCIRRADSLRLREQLRRTQSTLLQLCYCTKLRNEPAKKALAVGSWTPAQRCR